MKNTTIGRVDKQIRLSRARLLPFFARYQRATVLLEACGSAHHWGRELENLGHTVRLLPPHDVHRYVRRSKTDRTDAKALLEADRNEEIRPVPVKSVDQQAIASLHRLRFAYLAARTARINTVRGLLREFGVVIPQGARHVVPSVRALIDDPEARIPPTLRTPLGVACDEIHDFERRAQVIEKQLQSMAREMPLTERLMTIPGIGLLTATALVALVGDARRFRSGRHFASFLGLTPKEHSSGSRRRLGAISKKGDIYLRMLLTHGARSALWAAKSKERPDQLRAWALKVQERRGHNIATVALANKLARIVWVVWSKEVAYQELFAEA
jgi:transposase